MYRMVKALDINKSTGPNKHPGCLNVDNLDDGMSFAGSLCYCEKDNCNTNFDNNSASTTIVNVIIVVISLATSMILMK